MRCEDDRTGADVWRVKMDMRDRMDFFGSVSQKTKMLI